MIFGFLLEAFILFLQICVCLRSLLALRFIDLQLVNQVSQLFDFFFFARMAQLDLALDFPAINAFALAHHGQMLLDQDFFVRSNLEGVPELFLEALDLAVQLVAIFVDFVQLLLPLVEFHLLLVIAASHLLHIDFDRLDIDLLFLGLLTEQQHLLVHLTLMQLGLLIQLLFKGLSLPLLRVQLFDRLELVLVQAF